VRTVSRKNAGYLRFRRAGALHDPAIPVAGDRARSGVVDTVGTHVCVERLSGQADARGLMVGSTTTSDATLMAAYVRSSGSSMAFVSTATYTRSIGRRTVSVMNPEGDSALVSGLLITLVRRIT
jgi:hypothetical protein